jgi:phosphoglycolate phosphatase-like HAD superfamily hydrolase
MILIIFDVDGTLVQSNKVDSKCFASTYETVYGKAFPTIDWQKYPHVSDTTIFQTVIQEHFNRSVRPNEEEAFRQKFVESILKKRKEAPHEFSEVPFAKRTIDNLLEDERFIVGVATGGWKAPALVKLDFVDIPSQKLIISGADGKETREAIINETILNARKRHQNIQRMVYVGDAPWDVTTTRNMNLPLIGIRRKGDLDFLQQQGVAIVLKNYENYDAFLDGVEKATVPN